MRIAESNTGARRPTLALGVVSVLLTFAAVIVLRTPAHTSEAAVVVSTGPAVCLQLTGGQQLCFDPEHVAHLSLGSLRTGECVNTTRAGAADTAVMAEAFTLVRSAPASACAAS
ncbi:hypothetical protein [Kineococcus radiotolerans]|uniref:Uncharacterized protein n=1 Tax=Kineococcus radiotolerans (strain ATCC BAA-149 / DSM 14245 / SRS30216) TaxID=266940 RepID=A6WAT5_KINRD|nr:hypothetical protein [Kineococcus radiotolerans]ABS03924.1 hypothetical protein Krad_2445 [Kineococcus radiotolerans SRS30216 = ATCC BAA-149]